MIPALVFLGPTLSLAAARRLLDARYLPPVRQGDVYRAVRRWRPRLVGIVDGYFHEVPSVWHREILWALSEGVHVVGAGSMGALRAAELDPFGVRGVGRVFQAYRDGVFAPYDDPFEDDDEVAMLHGPPQTGFVALSDALVEIRDVLARAAASDVIDLATARRLVALAKATNYRERRLSGVLTNPLADLDETARSRIAEWAAANTASRKAEDAREMLMTIAELVESDPPPFAAPFLFEKTAVWHRFVMSEGELQSPLSAVESGVLTEARLNPDLWQEAQRVAAVRQAALATAKSVSASPASHAARARRDRLRRSLGLASDTALSEWMRRNALDDDACERFVLDHAELDALAEKEPPTDRAILDHLRLAGHFPALAERHGNKAAYCAGRRETGPSADLAQLVDWFLAARCSDQLVLPSPETLAAELGFADAAELAQALHMEWLYSAEADRAIRPASTRT